jgi:hypothetical protein
MEAVFPGTTEAVPKCQILELQPIKGAVLQGFSLKNRKSWLQNNQFWNQLNYLCYIYSRHWRIV